MAETKSKVVPVACDECGMDLTYTVTTDGDSRTCVMSCTWCGTVVDERVQTRHVSAALVNVGSGPCVRMNVETWG